MTEAQNTFIENIAQAAIKLYPQYKILPSLTIAMAIKESGWGKSQLSSKHFNFFGMKWTKTCGTSFVEYNTKEWDGSKYITIKAKFRSFGNFTEGIQGFYNFITGYKRYKNLIGEPDSNTACHLVQADGWATAPNYGDSLYADYVFKYDLIKYDDIVLGRTEQPAAPGVIIETPEENNTDLYTVVKGDSLWKISSKFLGNGIYWRKIYDYNNLKSTIIYPGQQLKIPGRS